ncbi:MAG: hypothetical protein M5U28_54060 [Sandaracinaceae bacterium]|nr:hypothetical protein [Sandaracinaceae bacterium]
MARLADRYLGKQLREIEISRLINDLVSGATKFGLEIPPDFLSRGQGADDHRGRRRRSTRSWTSSPR